MRRARSGERAETTAPEGAVTSRCCGTGEVSLDTLMDRQRIRVEETWTVPLCAWACPARPTRMYMDGRYCTPYSVQCTPPRAPPLHQAPSPIGEHDFFSSSKLESLARRQPCRRTQRRPSQLAPIRRPSERPTTRNRRLEYPQYTMVRGAAAGRGRPRGRGARAGASSGDAAQQPESAPPASTASDPISISSTPTASAASTPAPTTQPGPSAPSRGTTRPPGAALTGRLRPRNVRRNEEQREQLAQQEAKKDSERAAEERRLRGRMRFRGRRGRGNQFGPRVSKVEASGLFQNEHGGEHNPYRHLPQRGVVLFGP